jgi:predicted RNase H-like nuclease
VFVGVDLGWYGKPSGLAALTGSGTELRLSAVARVRGIPETMQWIHSQTGDADAVVAVDAPLVIPIQSGIRMAERQLNRQFRRNHAGCYPANLGRPFAPWPSARPWKPDYYETLVRQRGRMRRCPRESEGIFHGLRRGRGARSAHAVSDDAR